MTHDSQQSAVLFEYLVRITFFLPRIGVFLSIHEFPRFVYNRLAC